MFRENWRQKKANQSKPQSGSKFLEAGPYHGRYLVQTEQADDLLDWKYPCSVR